MADTSSKQRTRKEPLPTDIAARFVQLQRKTAADTRPRPKGERPPLPPSSSKQSESPREKQLPRDEFVREKPAARDEVVREKSSPKDEFARNMTTSTSTARLFNPHFDPIPLRRTHEHEILSEGSASPPKGVISRSQQRPEPSSTRRLFDPKRDPPARFAMLSKPTASLDEAVKSVSSHRSSGDYVSASSTSISSYPPSLGSSAFTLTSTSSSSSSPFNKNKEDPNSPVVTQLKRLYRDISHAERKVLDGDQGDSTDEPIRVVVQSRDQPVANVSDPWARLLADHKELAELMHNFLTLCLSPQVPVSFHQYPTNYNIPSRQWTNAFHRLLETLRRASATSPVALEHLSDFIYYAYNFYAGLLENPLLSHYRQGWLEALGDLARYRMAVSAHIASAPFGERIHDRPSSVFTAVKEPETRIDDSSSPSVGPGAAVALDVEPERETWRKTAKGWYAEALKETPLVGRLHHHLGNVSREVDGEEMRAVYHFVKSMVSTNPFATARESILTIFSPTAQARRMQPDARTSELFILLHGMIFTHISLDDFAATHARFMERLTLEGAEEREWIMMALINLSAIFEYGRHDSAIRNATLVAALGGHAPAAGVDKRVIAVVSRTEDLKIGDSAEDDKKMDVDEAEDKVHRTDNNIPRILSSESQDLSHSFHLALELTFSMLSYALRNPMRQANAFARPSLNPYITVLLISISILVKHSAVLPLLERAIPWDDIANFLNTVPRGIANSEVEHPTRTLTYGCEALPEDWCLRGTEWMRRVYERGFWKSDVWGSEVDVLDASEEAADGAIDGIIEEDEDDGSTRPNITKGRWVRSFRAGVHLVRAVDGFSWDKAERRWKVQGALKDKVEQWKEAERREREAEEQRRMRGARWDEMDIDDEEEEDEEVEEEDSDDEEDSDQVKELKARRRHFRALLLAAQNGGVPSRRRPPARSTAAASRAPLHVVAGYSILVVDTNILLSSLSMLSTLVESLRWTVVIPLAVVTELDGLSSNESQLGTAAVNALSYLTSHLRSHALSLKVQTSRGNYLSSLSVRREQVDLRDEFSWERNMDDLILRAAIWQNEHWVDRSALLKSASTKSTDPENAAKVILLSFDRNLRLKARSRQLNAADEKDMAAILAAGT
ncbi:hypothetical protein BU17DRAFT_101528 [Hysterangium stoloniferum]|nr:hypothetical protein BU17DRAFT_101528 [Hysterangium stoloniferum]